MKKIESTDFKKFIGTWKTEGKILKSTNTSESDSELKVEGTDIYELVLDGFYILHKAVVLMGNEKSETFELIQLDDTENKTKMSFYNSKGESGLMSGFLDGKSFRIDGKELRFAGEFNEVETEMKGKWQITDEQNEWQDFLEMRFTKRE